MEILKVNIPSSFVKKELKFADEKGSGEAKLFIGSMKKLKEFDDFFNDFDLDNHYVMYKKDLLDYLKRTELEYIAQKCGNYKQVNREYFDKKIYEIQNKDDQIVFTLVKFTDKSRVYIRTEGDEKWVFDLIREIALPKITDLVIEKEDKNFVFKLDINFENVCERENENKESIEPLAIIDKPHQRIFFGAPGTGKSYKLNQDAEECFGENYERVTFHPNYMYGNFVGSFKPFPEETGEKYPNGESKKSIIYKYVPGPLMRILVKALKNPNENFLLLIEEINRANTTAVFGDFFQLLDREKDGESEYAITTSEDVRMYLEASFEDIDEEIQNYILDKIGSGYERLVLPGNLYIWATMNSADQGVMPMDTAFKRRWDFTYIGIDEALNDPEIADEFDDYKFRITKDCIAKWNDFRVEVNKRLSECKIPEDKLIGPYFISKSVLESGDIDKITETVKNKVLMYLYDDAGKPHRNTLFVAEKSGTYSALCSNFDENGKAIFKKPLELGDESITPVDEDSINKDTKAIAYEMIEEGSKDIMANKVAENSVDLSEKE